ncbi:YaeQ family protein [Herpetosiphon sp. NSE202]|uniref:YaeQ family protein n=1 Tax=Herpetosiphon sp. NSE202 TaxID=3351349 RepID=UPI00364398A8
MALSATIYTINVDLANVDRNVYEQLELRVARQPSESAEYMLMRILAYCLEYTDGIAFTQGVAAGDEPAVWIRDLTGQVTGWFEVGAPDAERLHRGSKRAGRAAVYTHRDVAQVLGNFSGKTIYQAEQIPVYAFDRRFIETVANLIERRCDLGISVTEQQIYVEIAGQSLNSQIEEHRINN